MEYFRSKNGREVKAKEKIPPKNQKDATMQLVPLAFAGDHGELENKNPTNYIDTKKKTQKEID